MTKYVSADGEDASPLLGVDAGQEIRIVFLNVKAGNTKGGSITVLLTSGLTGLESAV
jgi:L-serine deaminase